MVTSKLIARNMMVHFSTTDYCLCTQDHWVYKYHYHTGRFSKYCRLPIASPGLVARVKDTLARSRIRQWLKPHLGIHDLIETADGHVVMVYGNIYLFHPGDSAAPYAKSLSTTNLGEVAGALKSGLTTHPHSGTVYYGEYRNGHSCATRVIKIDPQKQSVASCWEFSRQEIKHIHAIRYDPYRNRLWVTTGDQDHECAIYYTDDEFVTLHKLGGGDQRWRAISLLFYPNYIEWGMDAGKDAPAEAINHIYRYQLETGQLQQVATIGNPAYAAVHCVDGTAFMATAFEPGRLQATPEQAAIWYRNSKGDWEQCFDLAYQEASMQGITKYAMLCLPTGQLPAKTVPFTPMNCKNSHLQNLLLQVT